uniref:Patatin n=1 Tax=Daucus carota subsp. sativus TaxID=79200 RepID=A0A166IVX7_DAUCS
MSWGLGWKRATETFHLSLYYGTEDTLEDYSPSSSSRSSSDSSISSSPDQLAFQLQQQSGNPFDLGFRIDLEWNAGDDEDQVALRLQSQVMVALPAPQDSVELEFRVEEGNVGVDMKVVKRREPLRAVTMGRVGGWSHASDGMGVLIRLLRSNFSNSGGPGSPVGAGDGGGGCADHWKNVTLVSLCGCGLAALPVEITRLPHLEKLYLDNNKLSVLPPYLGELKDLKVLTVDYNMLASVPVELRKCVALVELSLEHNKLIEQACSALSSLASDITVAMQLMKSDIMKPIERVLRSAGSEDLISVLQIVVQLAFASDSVSQKMLTKDSLKSLKLLCAHKNQEASFLPLKGLALLAVGNLAFCLENRSTLATSESLRELLLRLTSSSVPRVSKAAARALAILGENESLRRAIKGRPVAKQGLRILSMDGGGMKGLATVQILREIEKGTGKQMHELFDLICGTSTGGMLAVALGIKLMSLDKCEDIYKKLGKLVFAEPVPKDNEAATWREKLDQLYKSSSQSFRVVVHGSKHSADQFERLLKEMCADEDGDLIIESAVKGTPKVFVVSSLVSMVPAQPFIFRNYQYPVGTVETPLAISESQPVGGSGSPTIGAKSGYKRNACIGSCKHQVWQSIRASSAAPYYLDDYSDDGYRWQDGAIVANNPTIFALREAQLLWPDAKVDCLVSIGCGSVSTKVRKGGWRYLDTGQVLIESACSVERVEEALSTLLPMLPEIQYFRFNPVDERCDMELDETDPTVWLKLEAATEEYIQNNSPAFKNLCERLLQNQQDDTSQYLKGKVPSSVSHENSPSLGWRRNVLLVEAYHSPDSGRVNHHARSLETYCARNGIRLTLGSELASGTYKDISRKNFQTPFTSPLFTGSFPSSPLLYSPDIGALRNGKIDMVPPLSLDGHQSAKSYASPPDSPLGHRQLSVLVKSLHEKLQNLPQVGIVHLALQNDTSGSILSWQNDVFVVAEPGELADKFLQSVKYSMLTILRGRQRKHASAITDISSISDLVACRPYFQVGCVVHRYIGRQTQVMEDGQEIGAYMFRRTVPSMHLTHDDVRWMVGAWRDRVIICTGTYGPTQALIKAFLDSGAKAVICPATEPHEMQITSFHGSIEFGALENGRFEIGEDEVEDDETEPASPASDWEDSEPDRCGEHGKFSWEDDEDEMSQFVCQLYESLLKAGARIDVALQNALASHRSLRFLCHLPTIQ